MDARKSGMKPCVTVDRRFRATIDLEIDPMPTPKPCGPEPSFPGFRPNSFL